MGLLIYGGLTLLFSLIAFKKHSKIVLLLLQFLPFLFLSVFLFLTRKEYEVLQIHKIGYQFEKVSADYRNPARSVYLGGEQAKDDLFAGTLPARALKITPSLADRSFEVEVLADGVLTMQNQRPLNAVFLRDGDQLTFETPVSKPLVFTSKGSLHRVFTADNQEWVWPRKLWRIRKIKEPFFTGSFDSHIHLLREIGKSLDLPLQSKAAIGLQRLHLSLSRQPLQLNRVVLLGTNGNVRLNGEPPVNRFKLSDGDTLEAYAIDSAQDPARLRLAAAYRIQNGDVFHFYLSNPQTLGMKESLLREGSAVNKPLLVSTSKLPYSAFPTVHYAKESQKFTGLFAFVQTHETVTEGNTLQQFQEQLLDFFSLKSKQFEVVTEEGTYRPLSGEQFSLGKTDQILFSVDRVSFPWNILQVLLILFLLKIIFQAPFFQAIENPAAQLITITVDFFLAARFLFAFRASSLYPFSSETVTLSLLALLAVPYLLFASALCFRKRWERVHLYNFALYTLLVITIAAFFLIDHLWLIAAAAFLASFVALLRFHPSSFLSRIKSRLPFRQGVRPEFILIALILFALLLQFFGAGEAVQIAGIRIPLAILYHPLFLVFSSYYLFQLKNALLVERNSTDLKRVFAIVVKFFALALLFLLLSFLFSDFGFFLLFCLPVLFLFFGIGVLFLSEYELSWKGAGAVMAAPLAVFLFLFTSYSTISKVLPVSYSENRYIQRLLLTLDPAALEESGLIAAEKQLGHQRTFLAYAHGGLSGGGYMNRSITPALSNTALNDNVPAAFLLNDFGILGFLGVLFVLLLWILLWIGAVGKEELRYPHLLSLAALVTLLYVDLYMILSNCGIFFFTGKNVFFWGLNSISDIFHSTVILLMVLVPIMENGTTKIEYPITFVRAHDPS